LTKQLKRGLARQILAAAIFGDLTPQAHQKAAAEC
jgi:hypothetical protein